MTEAEFEIYVGSLTGKTIILYTKHDATILDLKKHIFEKEGIKPQQQRLIFNSNNLYDENKAISHYGISAGSTLNLVIRLTNDKAIHYDEKINEKKDETHYNENWYYLENVDVWKPFDRFISLILCRRYNENIRNTKFVLFNNRIRYLFEFKDNWYHEMHEPNNYLICYGYLNENTAPFNMVSCAVPPKDVIRDEIELLYLLSNETNDIEIGIKQHLSLLPHPSDAFLFGTWFGELLYTFEYMTNQERKLNININLLFKYLKNKKLFKQIIGDKCGISAGVAHLLYNYLKDNDLKHDLYHQIHDFFTQLKHKKIIEIQLIFIKNGITSTNFLNEYLVDNNELQHFLKNILSLKLSVIQQLIPYIKSSFQINTNDKYVDDNIMYNIDRRRATTLIKPKRQKAITSFNIWLTRNVIYSKKELIKQQNDVSRYILQNDLGSQALNKIGKKQFVCQLNAKCEIAIGPLNLLYDNLPTDYMDQYTAKEIGEFISNYLYELRYNNIQRIRDRCIASNINDQEFAKSIAPNKNNSLAHFIRNNIKIKSNYKINELIPKIQEYAQNLYTHFDIIHTVDNNIIETKDNDVEAAFGTWISELCFERKKLSKQQQMMTVYIKKGDIDEWDFRKLLIDKLYIDPPNVAQIILMQQTPQPQHELIQKIAKILYNARTKYMSLIRSKCNYLAKEGMNDDYFLNTIVVNDVKLSKFLIHNIGIKQLNEIPQLIHNIRTYLSSLRIIKSDDIADDDIRTQSIYGNKLGQWIGEIIHDRLIYLIRAKTVHNFIVVNHWDSGILPHIGKKQFVHHLKQYANTQLLNEIWNRLERRYINNADAFHATHNKIAIDVFEFIREIRRANIYQIAVECAKDIECVDAKTFYTKIGANKTVLRKFIYKILANTNQETLITDIFGKELIIEKIYYLLSVDVEDNNVLFENWLSSIIYDPVSLWLNCAHIRYFLAEENVNCDRVKLWGKHKFEEKASFVCNSLNSDQMNQLFAISKRNHDKDDIYDCIAQKLRKQHRNKRNKCKQFIADKNVNKLSFLNVTATDHVKLIEFIDKDLGISYDKERDFVNGITERLRLCLKIHTNLFDNKFNDEYCDNNDEYKEIELKINNLNEKESEKEIKKHSEWIEKDMFQIKELNNYQLAFALCYNILNNKAFEECITTVYNRLIIQSTFDANYVSQYILSAKKQFDIDKKEEITYSTWKYKGGIHELETNELIDLMEQCLNCNPYYNNKIQNIAQKIIDTNMNGILFVNNLNLNKNVFVHRMMECFGDKSNYKLVQNIYDDLAQNKVICDEIKDYSVLKLSNYLMRYQMNKIKGNIKLKELIKYKRYEFAAKLKDICSLPIGVGTMLFKKMMQFDFIDTNNDAQNTLRDNPSIQFVSLITKTLALSDITLCNVFWNTFLEKYNNGELFIMTESEIMRYIYGYRVNTFYNNVLSETCNNDDGNKYKIAQKWIKKHFKWLNDDTKYSNFYDNLNEYIAEYFKSDLMLIIIYKQKCELFKGDGIRFLLRLDFNHINYDKLSGLKDNEIDDMISNHKKGFNARNVENIMREIKVFIKKERRSQQTKCALWKLSDIELYLITQILNEMALMRSDLKRNNTLDTLFCIKYFSVFIEEYVSNPLNDMNQLMERKARNEVLYHVNHDVIPQIASDIFISWIKGKVPQPLEDENQEGFLSRSINRMLSALSNN